MQTFDQHLIDLLRANKISRETAMNAASNPTDLKTRLEMEGSIAEDELEQEKPEAPFDADSDERF